MNILEAMKKITPAQWQALKSIIDFHGGDPDVINWLLKDINDKQSWNIEYDYFEHDDEKWYLLNSDREMVIATADKILPLRELAEQYGKEVDIDGSRHPNYGKESFY